MTLVGTGRLAGTPSGSDADDAFTSGCSPLAWSLAERSACSQQQSAIRGGGERHLGDIPHHKLTARAGMPGFRMLPLRCAVKWPRILIKVWEQPGGRF